MPETELSPIARALGRIPSGLFIVTTRDGERPLGFLGQRASGEGDRDMVSTPSAMDHDEGAATGDGRASRGRARPARIELGATVSLGERSGEFG